MAGPIERQLRARLGDGRGMTEAEIRALPGALPMAYFRGWRRRGLLVLRADHRWHLRERLLGEEARAALEARSEREASEAVERAEGAERAAAELRRGQRRAVLLELRGARTVEDARRIATEHRLSAMAARAIERVVVAPNEMTDPELAALFGIEFDTLSA